ncbi:hypothetical protein Pfo_015541 [Paulownia fortunei]|nr:hypothetical protein Pfo_015541 [Paulownia fortunei]
MDSSNSGSSSSYMEDYPKTHDIIRWNSGKRVDPRLLALLESFGEIYMDRHEFFKKIFHGNHEEVFKKIGDALRKKKQMKKSRSMPRSLSMRAIKQRGVDDESDGLRLERFKVRTPNVIVAGPDGTGPTGQGVQTQTTQGSSKDTK